MKRLYFVILQAKCSTEKIFKNTDRKPPSCFYWYRLIGPCVSPSEMKTLIFWRVWMILDVHGAFIFHSWMFALVVPTRAGSINFLICFVALNFLQFVTGGAALDFLLRPSVERKNRKKSYTERMRRFSKQTGRLEIQKTERKVQSEISHSWSRRRVNLFMPDLLGRTL